MTVPLLSHVSPVTYHLSPSRLAPLMPHLVLSGAFLAFDHASLALLLWTCAPLCTCQVRSAGEDAWLGKPAPEDPTLDAPSNHSASLLQIGSGHPDCKDMHLVSKEAASHTLTTGVLLSLVLCVQLYQMLLSHVHSGCSGCMT